MAKRKTKRPKARGAAEAAPPVVEAGAADEPSLLPKPRSGRVQVALILLALAYIVTVWLDGIGSNLPARVTPRVWLYFSQVAALFKNAGVMAIDYRSEGWSCEKKRWIEVDLRPHFRIDADNKENRFHRALQFYRKDRKVMRALEEYVVKSHNASSSEKIVGVRFLSLRIPYPKIGDRVVPYERKPLASYPNEMRHAWYWTPMTKRRELCGDPAPPPKDEPEDAPAATDPREPE